MDITQNLIKINQTPVPGTENQKLSKQLDAPGKSFNQILAMFNFIGQTPQIEGSTPSVNQNQIDQINSSDGMNLKDEDLEELESILAQFLGEIKMFQFITDPEESSNLLTSNKTQISPLLSGEHSIDQITSELTEQLGQWFQKAEGTNEFVSFDMEKVLQKLERLVAELQFKDDQNLFDIENDVVQKIQMMLEEIKLERQYVEKVTDQNTPDINISMNDEENQYVSSNPIQSDLKSFIQEESFSFSENLDELTNSKLQSVIVTNSQSSLDNGVESKTTQSTPQLTIATFVPEVSEFAGRYLRIINGQSGSTVAKFNLFPEHLGHLEVQIVSQEGQVSVQIVTDSSLAKESLESQLQQLRQSLLSQGLQVQKLEIIQQPPTTLDSSQAGLSFSHGESSSSHEQPFYYLERDDSKKQQIDVEEIDRERELVSTTYGRSAPTAASRIDFTA